MAVAAKTLVLLLLVLTGLCSCSEDTSLGPAVVSSCYTTADAVLSMETVFIVELSLTWKTRTLNTPLYADVGGKQFPVTRGHEAGRYQVSWSVEHERAPAGAYEVRFFEEDTYSLLRRAQRSGEDAAAIRPLFTVEVTHPGAWSGPWVSSEVLAAAVGIAICSLAFRAKSGLQT